jgi:hypothetical protein
MKRAILFFVAGLLLLSCKKSYKGTADMQGYLMYECGSNDPLGGVNVSFVSNGTAYLSTTTDAYGFFHLKGDYDIKVGGAEAYETFLSIEYNGQNGGGFGSVKLMSFPPDVFNDTLFRYNTTLSVLIVELDNPVVGDELDTLTIEYRPDPKQGGYAYLKIAGPFYHGDILDTILTPTASHIGYGNGITSIGGPCNFRLNKHVNPNAKIHYPQYPWVTGQPNNACGNYTNVYLKLD